MTASDRQQIKDNQRLKLRAGNVAARPFKNAYRGPLEEGIVFLTLVYCVLCTRLTSSLSQLQTHPSLIHPWLLPLSLLCSTRTLSPIWYMRVVVWSKETLFPAVVAASAVIFVVSVCVFIYCL